MSATATQPLTVTLPVCPVCQRAGKIPAGHFSGKEFCTGPIDSAHKKTRMRPRTFQMVGEESK